MSIHYAKLDKSQRLQRVLAALSSGRPLTTLDIIREANVCAVNSCITELRRNGYGITCRAVKGQRGVYEYQLAEAA